MRSLKAVLVLGGVACFSAAVYAALLGVGPVLGFPKTDFSGPSVGGTVYDATTRQLTVTALPVSTTFVPAGPARPVTNPKLLSFKLLVPDNAGTTTATVVGDDFLLTGQIDEDGDGSIDDAGVLLTGEILAFGWLNTPTPTDPMDFRFRVTGGSLAPKYNGKDIGVTLTMERSNFAGTFSSGFSAGSKGFVGPIPCAGRIGDFVWHDQNRNGLQDPGEPGIDGVTVTLTGTDSFGNAVSRTTTTASGPMEQKGYYQFTGLCGGTYTVTADTPGGFVPTNSLVGADRGVDSNGSPTTVSLETLSDQTIDFGFQTACTGAIGNFVWHDTNRNGLQDPDEPGIDNVHVTLVDPTDETIVLGTTTTGPNGFYKFTGLCAGSYKVKVDESDLQVGFTPTTTLVPPDATVDSNPNPFVVALPADNTEDLTVDFGYLSPCTGSLGDFVWYDKNQNGVQDPTEPGIAGVTLKLKDATDNLITTTTTGANGVYQFTGLCANTYRVEVDLTSIPAGFSPTAVQIGGDTALDSNPNPHQVTLTTDASSDITIDFGYIAACTGQIGDFVWNDLNKNGIQDGLEPPMAGVVVNLKSPDNTIIQTDTTDANGLYLFEGLCPGTYKVEVIPPAGSVASPVEQGGNITIDSNPNPTSVTLVFDDSTDVTNDFGFFFPPASLGDFVWQDMNRNGLQDVGEPGIDGVPVQLFACGATTPLESTLTAGGGAYLFDDLAAGCYEVGFGKPAGYVRTLANSGADDTNDSDADVATGRTGSYTLAWGEFNPTVDSGLYRPAALGDYVWLDSNGNGLQDAGETQGVVGAVATLYACGDTTAALASQSIGASGLYLFNNLVPGSYMVKFTLPSGYTFTLPNAGGDDAKDSDANTTTGFSPCVTLLSGQTNLTVDAGAVIPTPVCVSSTLIFSGSSATSGTYGNIREFSYTGVKVRASAFSRYKTANTWETAYLGAYSLGLGVTDRSEGTGGNDSHTVDNSGRNNYVLLEFSAPIVVTQAFLDYVGADSDVQVWVGTFNNPFANHLSLNDSVLGTFGLTESSDTASADARWALFNGGGVVGNAVVIAARPDHTNDSFKLRKLQVCVPQAPQASLGDFVWHDENANGIQDATEVGIDGATVKLLDGANNVLATRTTGDDPNASGTQKGYYEFTGLTPGATYKVQFLKPAGFDTASPRKLGGNVAKDSDGLTSDSVVLAANEFNRTIDAGFYKTAPVCVPTTLTFAGTSTTSGTKGNIRTYTFGTLSVKVSAFSRLKSSATWYTAYLGAYSSGLGVTDGAEGDGSADRHVVDNIDRNNYVLFEFSSPVVVDQAYLDYVRGDSDISMWFGNNPTGVNPFASHLTLSDTVLNAFSVKESNSTTSTVARWADINGGGATGNGLVIASQVDQANDGFKLHKLLVCK